MNLASKIQLVLVRLSCFFMLTVGRNFVRMLWEVCACSRYNKTVNIFDSRYIVGNTINALSLPLYHVNVLSVHVY